jgi:uncharacterized peroxidase-related enzyme
MTTFHVPTREEVTPANQLIFDNLKASIGFLPNLYATIGYSEHGLASYLQFQNAKTSLSKKEKEVVNLVVSQVNGCAYCLSAHTAIGKMNGFTDDQILEIRGGSASFNPKFDALARFAREVTLNKGRIDPAVTDAFFAAGYTRESVVDVILNIAEKVAMNYLHNLTSIPVDFPAVPELETTKA